MRRARIRGEGLSYYHCPSRVVDRQFILGDEERDHFVILVRKLEAFLGLRVVTYAGMSNQFHLLVEGPTGLSRLLWIATPFSNGLAFSTTRSPSRPCARNWIEPLGVVIASGSSKSWIATRDAWEMSPSS